MALISSSNASTLFCLLLLLSGSVASATMFTLFNNCKYNIWPVTLSNSGTILGDHGVTLAPSTSLQMTVPAGWSGRLWARTGCNFDAAENGKCVTGDCPGGLRCTGEAPPPATLTTFIVGTADNGYHDLYAVNLVYGYNIAMEVRATGGTGECQTTSCVFDMNGNCPKELQVKDTNGSVVGCNSACAAFNTAEYCCFGDHETCPPTNYSDMFKSACPGAYNYGYDDASISTCSGSDYTITFCSAGSL